MNDIADTSVKYTIRLFDLVKSSRKIYIGQKGCTKKMSFLWEGYGFISF